MEQRKGRGDIGEILGLRGGDIMNITKIRAAFTLLDYDVSQDTDEDVLKLYNDSYIGGWAQVLMEAADNAQPAIRIYHPDRAKMAGNVIRGILKTKKELEEALDIYGAEMLAEIYNTTAEAREEE